MCTEAICEAGEVVNTNRGFRLALSRFGLTFWPIGFDNPT